MTEYEAGIRSLRAEMLSLAKEELSVRAGGPSSSVAEGVGAQRQGRLNLLNRSRLKTASIYNALPYLLDYEEALVPALTIGREREGGECFLEFIQTMIRHQPCALHEIKVKFD